MKKSFQFPYKAYGKEFYPIIGIQIKGRSQILSTQAYVDTGASTSIFLSSIASELGIDFTKGKLSYIMVGDGSFIPIYLHKVHILIGRIWVKATIGFSKHLGADFNLLGQKDIFDRFKVTFDKRKKFIAFNPY